MGPVHGAEGRLVLIGTHDCQHPNGLVRIRSIGRMAGERQVVVVDLEEVAFVPDRHCAEIVFAMGVIALIEGGEAGHGTRQFGEVAGSHGLAAWRDHDLERARIGGRAVEGGLAQQVIEGADAGGTVGEGGHRSGFPWVALAPWGGRSRAARLYGRRQGPTRERQRTERAGPCRRLACGQSTRLKPTGQRGTIRNVVLGAG